MHHTLQKECEVKPPVKRHTHPREESFLKICSFSNRVCLPNSGIWSWTSVKWIFSVHANSEYAAGKKGAAAVSTTGSGWVPVQGSPYAADLDRCAHSLDLRGPLLNSPDWSSGQGYSSTTTQRKTTANFTEHNVRGEIQLKNQNWKVLGSLWWLTQWLEKESGKE